MIFDIFFFTFKLTKVWPPRNNRQLCNELPSWILPGTDLSTQPRSVLERADLFSGSACKRFPFRANLSIGIFRWNRCLPFCYFRAKLETNRTLERHKAVPSPLLIKHTLSYETWIILGKYLRFLSSTLPLRVTLTWVNPI